jgi:uncharacterized protein YacL (UPF0231 family)
MQLQFYWDSAGDPRARCPLAAFLESDVQGSLEFAHEILRALDRIESGEEETWEVTGNAHTLTLARDEATIRSEVDEDAEPYVLPPGLLREVVADWVSFLDEGRGV